MLKTKFILALLPALLICQSPLLAQYGDVVTPPKSLADGFNSITPKQCEEFLGVLSGPGFEGRGTGQTGYTKAAHWVAGKLAEFGLEPVGDNGTYFQMLPMKRRVIEVEQSSISGPDNLIIEADGNFGLERFTDAQVTSGELVFINFAGENSTLPTELNLREKIVVYCGDKSSKRAAIQLARKRPLATLRMIESTPASRSQLIRGGGRTRNTSVSGTISKDAAMKLARALGKEAWLDEKNPTTFIQPSGESIDIRMRYRVEPAAVPNVVAWLEGSDPKLKDEYIVIGSHLDHLGIRNGQIYPGADDNGSGSTAVLNVAKAMATNKLRPKRSVLFIWFAAEEIGLVGSRHYCDNPMLPLDKMICMFNIDMVGRNEQTSSETAAENEGAIHLVGSRKGNTDIDAIVQQANRHVGFRFEYDEEDVFGRSDQINFYRKGVPVAFLFGGFHPDYHQPGDLPAKINFKKIASAAKLYYVAIHLASEHGRFQLK